MSQPDVSTEKRFDLVAVALSKDNSVTQGAVMFSATAVLKVNNKVFSMLAGGRLMFDGAVLALLESGGERDGGDLERALVRFLQEREELRAGADGS